MGGKFVDFDWLDYISSVTLEAWQQMNNTGSLILEIMEYLVCNVADSIMKWFTIKAMDAIAWMCTTMNKPRKSIVTVSQS